MNRAISSVLAAGALFACAHVAHAQQVQIPTLQVCNISKASGKALVRIESRSDIAHSGSFEIGLEVGCDPRNPGYPTGSIGIANISMTDSTIQGNIVATSIEQLTSTGKHSPTLYVNGRCKADGDAAIGCRFWLMIANNSPGPDKGTPDVVSFLVMNGLGKRIAYGTGPVEKGDIVVQPTGN